MKKDKRLSDDHESFLDFTTISLASLLVVALGVFLSHVFSLFETFQEETRKQQHLIHSTVDNRGVKNLLVGESETLEQVVIDFVDRNEPFVCRACIKEANLKFWDNDGNIRKVVENENVLLPIRVSRLKDNDTTLFSRRNTVPNTAESAYQQQDMSFSDFLDVYDQNGDNGSHYYGAQINVLELFPSLLPYIQRSAPSVAILNSIGPTPSMKQRPLSVYFGKGPLTTQTHYDSLENFVCVVAGGTKKFDLFDPATSSLFLYVDRSKHGNASPVRTTREFPLSKYAIPSTVELHPGDCLYLPVYWYHTVTTSAHRTISVNWWRRPQHLKMTILDRIFCGRDDQESRAKC